MSFEAYRDDEGYLTVIDKKSLPSGMTVQIEFEMSDLSNVCVANVFLNVYKKRKQISSNTLHQTGKDGVDPFIWALKKIRDFEAYASEYLTNPLPAYIQVCWDDNRRGRIYKRFLLREGFELKDFGEGTMLYKQIKLAD